MELLETEIATLEAEKKSLEEQLSSGSLPLDTLTRNSVRIGEVIALVDQKSMRWLELSEIEA